MKCAWVSWSDRINITCEPPSHPHSSGRWVRLDYDLSVERSVRRGLQPTQFGGCEEGSGMS
ncbi:hypothetical protein BJX62DRAFT_219222 [Aspergillus germanicus]